LKPKIEFVIKLALTPLQLELYVMFVESLQDDTNELSNTKLWAWLKYLHLLCCHPKVFVKFLKQKIEEKKAQDRQDREKQGHQENGEQVPSMAAGAGERLMQLYQKSDIAELLMSHRVGIIAKILEESKKMNDQVLVFSHHLPVLDYLEKYIRRAMPGLDMLRIDSRTPTSIGRRRLYDCQ